MVVIMNFFKIFKKADRSSKNRESLTESECKKIFKSFKCPDCGGVLKEGPTGGMSMNVCCSRCFSEFNITIWGGFCLGERISDAGPREIGNRALLYHLTHH